MKSNRAARLAFTVALWALGILSAGVATAAPAGSPWGANYFPNVPLVTHEGQTIRFYDDLIKDKIVIVSFIYTSCKSECPLITANLARVEKLLGDRVGREVFMYSISIDPEHDTPEALKEYAARFHTGPGWLFLTGKPEDIQLIRTKFRDREPIEDHSGVLKIGNDRTGQWVSNSAIDTPAYIAKVVGNWMDPNWQQRELPASVPVVAVALPSDAGPGQALFRKTCAACHQIGGGDLVGPDLKGVTQRREREWLARFLLAPDQMLERGDPIASELFAKYKIPMPNLKLTERDAADLITYIDARSEATQK